MKNEATQPDPAQLAAIGEPNTWDGVQVARVRGREYRLAWAAPDSIAVVKVSGVTRALNMDVDLTRENQAEIRRDSSGKWKANVTGGSVAAATWRVAVEQLDEIWATR